MKQHKLRIMLSTNAPWSTSGYGQAAAELLPLIQQEGYPLACIDFFGLQGGKIILDGVLHYPTINHPYGSDAIVLHGKDFNADVIFTMQDQWVLIPQDLQQLKRWIPITPVDHDPMTKAVLNNLRYAYRVVTWTKHGQKELAKNGIAAEYIPLTVNTDIFVPMNKIDRKQAAGLPGDCVLIGMVAANKDNPPRKSFQEALDAFKLFLEKVPKAMMYIHSNPEFPGGFNFLQYAEYIGIRNKIIFPDMYEMNFNTGKDKMALIYNTLDMLLAPSMSEGFGVPIIEAQACGVPVVTNDYVSMPELIIPGVTGELCQQIEGPSGRRFSPQGSYMGIPDTTSIFEAMMKIVRMDAGKTRKACREWIVSNYDTKKVYKEKWSPYLEKLEKEVYGAAIDNKEGK